MKRPLFTKHTAFILAALLLASSMTACGKTEPKETEQSPPTDVVETNTPAAESPAATVPETVAPAPSYDASLITENGIAKAHIVLFDRATDIEKTAAEELVLHIKKVSGAEIPVTNAVQPDSLPIIIATPDSLPELEELFPEDLAWLRTLKEDDGRVWADDGFAVRAHDGKIYIFGTNAVGALNGTYDFIEENLGVIWIGRTDAGIIYDEMPTITTVKTDYREKSPFTVTSAYSYSEDIFRQRNKQFVTVYHYGNDANVKSLVLSSPIYDPNIDEYWDTDDKGNHLLPGNSKDGTVTIPAEESKHVNFWSQLTADTVAASVIAQLDAMDDATRPKSFNVCMEDNNTLCVYPEMTEPFEYAPGQFVEPDDSDYITTVYFTFINRVARKVAEKYPDVTINTLAYIFATGSPRCELEKNVSVWFCPICEDYNQENFAVALAEYEEGLQIDSTLEAKYLYDWIEQHPDTPITIYNYYFCSFVQGWYERPLWYRLQNDFQLFAENGFIGTTSCAAPSEGGTGLYNRWQKGDPSPYAFTRDEGYKMNVMSQWIYYKLLWNPYEDIESVIVEFCDKVYGDASDEMQEYYAILLKGWNYGSTEILPYEFNAKIFWDIDQEFYYNYFLDIETDDGVYILDALKDTITRAYEAADGYAKELIRYPYEVYQDWERLLQ